MDCPGSAHGLPEERPWAARGAPSERTATARGAPGERPRTARGAPMDCPGSAHGLHEERPGAARGAPSDCTRSARRAHSDRPRDDAQRFPEGRRPTIARGTTPSKRATIEIRPSTNILTHRMLIERPQRLNEWPRVCVGSTSAARGRRRTTHETDARDHLKTHRRWCYTSMGSLTIA